MNYLQLCQKVRRDCEIPGTGPTDVTSQTGELLDLVERVAETWTEIQGEQKNWRWMQHRFTFNTTANQDNYAYGAITDVEDAALITRFKRWIAQDWRSPFKIYLTASGVGNESWLTYLPWNEFEQIYRIGTQTASRPSFVSINPQNEIVLGPEPNDTYTVTGNYQLSAQTLAADDDIPEMPTDFHMLIAYETIKKYAYGESAPEILARGEAGADSLRYQLEADQLDSLSLGGPLA